MRSRSSLAILVIVAAAISGCGNPVRKGIESGVAKSLMQTLGPAKSYDVRVYGPTLRLINGKIDAIDISGAQVRLPSGLTVSRLFVRVEELTVDPDTRQIRGAAKTIYEAAISEAELNRYLAKAYPAIPGLNLALKQDYLTLAASPGIGGIRARIEADAGLGVRHGRILALDLKDVRTVGISAPGLARNFIEERLPVVFDVRGLGFDATISNVDVSKQAVTIAGELDLMAAVKKQSP